MCMSCIGFQNTVQGSFSWILKEMGWYNSKKMRCLLILSLSNTKEWALDLGVKIGFNSKLHIYGWHTKFYCVFFSVRIAGDFY